MSKEKDHLEMTTFTSYIDGFIRGWTAAGGSPTKLTAELLWEKASNSTKSRTTRTEFDQFVNLFLKNPPVPA